MSLQAAMHNNEIRGEIMRKGPRKLCVFLLAGLAVAAVAAVGCGGGESGADDSSAKSTISAGDRALARQIYTDRCVTCHGSTGHGDGPSAAALTPKPRSYADAAWQKKVTDASIEKAILEGGPAVGLSVMMPGNPDLANKPGVVQGLREIVRSFAN